MDVGADDAARVGRPQGFRYDGDLGELYKIFARNVALDLVTLGIYRFWGITRLRRYQWAHTSFDGDRFEYTGTGGELFKAFLLAIILYTGAALAVTGLNVVAQGVHPALRGLVALVFGMFIALLGDVGRFAALRYRLSRTSWCGISGGVTGSAWNYAGRAVRYRLFQYWTLGLMTPRKDLRLAELRIDASQFGSGTFRFNRSGVSVYRSFLLTYFLRIVVAVVGFVLVVAIFVRFRDPIARGPQIPNIPPLAMLGVAAIVVGAVVLWQAAGALYGAALTRRIAASTTFETLGWRGDVSAATLFRLRIGNLLIWLLTLGLGRPIILHRTATFLARAFELTGTPDRTHLTQTTLARPRMGEGLLNVLDSGGIL